VSHIPDIGKMVSDTPRTDAAKFWSDIGGWVTPASKFMELERELNAANERIKRLEEVGDKLYSAIYCGCLMDGPCKTCSDAADLWDEIKEAKP
jgi:hypothetical protein